MKKLFLSISLIFSFSILWGQTQIYVLDFETSGGYSTSMPEQTDNGGDYFTRTDGSDISGTYNSPQGSYFFAAQDLDADGMSTPATLSIDDIDISGYTDLEIRIYIAEDDDGTNEDWDDDDYLHIDYDIDNSGNFSNGIWVENDGSTYNSAPYIDNDYDGVGDGTEITDTFAQFTKSIPDTGSLMDIKVTFGNLVSADEDVAIDHIEVWGTAASSNDTDSYAGSGTQPAGATIDSTNDTEAEAVDVFVMDIYDQGTSDGLPTKITKIRIKPYTTNTADWTDNIQGFVITDSNGNTITPASTTITDTYIDFEFNTGDLDVPDNDLIELTFSVYLNTSNIEDGKILSFMVDADDHGFTADSSGSGFESTFTDGDFNSNDFTIGVEITEIRFQQQPSNVSLGQVMTPPVVVIATDENGNIDIDFDGSGTAIGLTTTGSFDPSATTEVDAVQGVATFDNLIFDTEATDITLTTTDPDNWGWTNITSDEFDVINACATELIISEYIEGSGSNKFLELYNGTGSDVDLSNYEIRQYNNGDTSPTYTLSLSGTLADGAAYVIENDDEDLGVDADLSTNSNVMAFNGDDAIELYNTDTGSSVDIIGKIGEDPGSYWGSGSNTTQNHTLVRKADITQGDTNGSDDFDPADQWEAYDEDTVSYLGSHTMNCGTCSAPSTDAAFDSDSPQDITGISATLSWSNGGGEKRIVVMRDGSDVSFVPSDDTTYSANSSFGAGTDVSGNGEYIVYNDNGNSVSVSGLSAGHTYYVKIFEYNCDAGNEKYYTTGSPASDYFVTIPYNPEDFNIGCITNTTIELSWTPPYAGEYDGYLLVVREGDNTPHSVSAVNPTSIGDADTNYPDAGEFGSTTPYSRYLYVGTATNATITGLTEGTEYTFKIYTYSVEANEFQYSSGSQSLQMIDLNDIETAHATPGNEQATIYWFNPEGCYDEIMVVANETSGIDFTPSGDGSSYTADSQYNAVDQVVFKGTDNNVTVTSLTNDTTYYFEIFVRKGTEWSNGIEVSATPRQGTEFQPGQLIFTAYDGQINGSGADDEYLIATLVDMEPGTIFSLVNSRYEAGAPAGVRTDKWGGAGDDAGANPGVAEIIYTGSNTIPAGSVIRLDTDYTESFLTYAGVIEGTTETDITGDFSVSIVYGTTSIPNISTSGSDQIFLVQGAFVFDGTQDDYEANYILQGTLLHGITNRVEWVDLSEACNGDDSGGNTRESRLPGLLNCFNVENADSSAVSGYYQNDELHDGSFRDIIMAISTDSYWTLGDDRYNLDPSTTNDTDAGHTFNISGGNAPGTWVSTSDTNWFNCSNWETLSVPDPETDVSIDSNSSVDAVIDSSAPYADLFNGVAECHNLTISNLNVKVEGNQILKIYGDLDIQSGGNLDADDDDDTTIDANIYIYGNWTNDNKDNFLEGNSTVIFEGSNPQTVSTDSGNQTEEFYNIIINNPAGVTFAGGNIHAIHDLDIQADTPITITDGHYLLAGHNLNNNTDIIIENEGSLVQTDDNGTIGGNGTFKLNKTSLPLDHYYDYVFWSSPIQPGNLTMGDIRPDAWRYFEYDPTDVANGGLYPGWVMLSTTDQANAGVGYAISAPVNHTAGNTLSASFIKGNDPFNNGEITVNIYQRGGTNDYGDNNLLGNPYPSAIDFDAFANDSDNSSNVEGSYALWTNCAGLDADNHHQESGFTTYTAGGGGTATEACGSGGATAGRYIATAQGFMINGTTDNSTAVFKNAHREIGNNDNFLNRPATVDREVAWIDITDGNGKFNQIAVGFYPEATDDYDRLYDARNANAGSGFCLSSLLNGKKLVIQGLEKITPINRSIPLAIENDANRNITFHINHLEGFDNVDIYLKDNYLNTLHDIKATDYLTTVDAGEFTDRFELIFTQVLDIDEQSIDPNAVLLIQNEGIFKLQAAGKHQITGVQVYDVTGKSVFETTAIKQTEISIDLSQIPAGNLLLFRIQLDNQSQMIKKSIRQ